MNIEMMFNCKDLVGELRDGSYTIPDGSTVETAVDAAAAEDGRELSASVKGALVFLVNGRHCSWETGLQDGDKLRVLFKSLGG